MEHPDIFRIVIIDNDAETISSVALNIEYIESIYNAGYEYHSEFSPGTRYTFAVFKRSQIQDKQDSSREDTP